MRQQRPLVVKKDNYIRAVKAENHHHHKWKLKCWPPAGLSTILPQPEAWWRDPKALPKVTEVKRAVSVYSLPPALHHVNTLLRLHHQLLHSRLICIISGKIQTRWVERNINPALNVLGFFSDSSSEMVLASATTNKETMVRRRRKTKQNNRWGFFS